MKKCFFALVLPLALLLTACGREPRPAALLLGQAADLNESEPLLVIDGQNIPAWEYLYWLALDCRQMEERCEAAGEPVDWTAPLSEGGTPEDLVKADALADTALYAAVGTWAAAYGCTLTDAERNALPERHYAYLTLEQGRHLTETGVQYAKLYALYETPGSALAPAENELALFEQQTAPLTAERLLIPFESDREAARQKAAELFAHLNPLRIRQPPLTRCWQRPEAHYWKKRIGRPPFRMRRPLWNRDSFPALSRPKTVSSSSGVCLRTGMLCGKPTSTACCKVPLTPARSGSLPPMKPCVPPPSGPH